MYSEFLIVGLISVLITIAVMSLITYFVLRKKRKTFAGQIVLLTVVFLTVSISTRLVFRGPVYELAAIPIFFFQDIVTVIIGLIVGWRFLPLIVQHDSSVPDYSSPTLLKNSIRDILDSEQFLTALRSTLPKGEDDKE